MKALRFLARRLFGTVLVLLGVSVVIFTLARVIPGDPARMALGPMASQGQVVALRKELGFDRPYVEQYGRFLHDALTLNFGLSLYSNRPAGVDIRQLFPATFELVLASGLVMIFLGVLLGVLSASHADTWVDHLVRPISLLAVATPTFVWAVFLMLVFAFWTHLLPVAGRLPDNAIVPARITGLLTIDSALAGNWPLFLESLRHITLPALALAMPGIGQIARLTRANLLETYRTPYTEFARAFAFRAREIALKYALRPAFIPTLTVIGLQFAATLGNAFLVEAIFGWPGLARYGVQTVLRKDLNGMVAVVMVIALFFAIVNVLVDILVMFIDPRIRERSR